MKSFIHDDFLLTNQVGKELYHGYAANMPIFDYHCHLNPKEIAENKQYRNITELWLGGDHYKWRAIGRTALRKYNPGQRWRSLRNGQRPCRTASITPSIGPI